MYPFILVGVGGFIGSITRFLVGQLFLNPSSFIPLPIIIVNIVGSFLIGLVLGLPQNFLPANWQFFLVPGILGGFTTFSSFSAEAITLLSKGLYTQASLYISLNLIGGLLACMLGVCLMKWING